MVRDANARSPGWLDSRLDSRFTFVYFKMPLPYVKKTLSYGGIQRERFHAAVERAAKALVTLDACHTLAHTTNGARNGDRCFTLYTCR